MTYLKTVFLSLPRFARTLLAGLLLLSLHSSGQEQTLILNDTSYIYRSLREAMLNPERVFRLNLSRSRIDTFPAELFSFPNLQELDLSRNRLDSIPAGIGTLSHLKRLNLANNKLAQLPEEIGQLTELTFLGLNRNVLVSLPPTIGRLENLEYLELWDNELDDVPDEIANLKNLKVLEMRGILFTDEQQARIDSLVVKSAKIYMSPSCVCKN